MVGGFVGLGGKLILTTFSFEPNFPESSPPVANPTAVSFGGLGGGIEPADFGSGCLSSFFIKLTVVWQIMDSRKSRKPIFQDRTK
jgi:hypothetical protein